MQLERGDGYCLRLPFVACDRYAAGHNAIRVSGPDEKLALEVLLVIGQQKMPALVGPAFLAV
jgi:hypothetical protein